MTDLQKDQAIYQAMCEIANNVFDNAIANHAGLRKYMGETEVLYQSTTLQRLVPMSIR